MLMLLRVPLLPFSPYAAHITLMPYIIFAITPLLLHYFDMTPLRLRCHDAIIISPFIISLFFFRLLRDYYADDTIAIISTMITISLPAAYYAAIICHIARHDAIFMRDMLLCHMRDAPAMMIIIFITLSLSLRAIIC
jgi:hypothetical protein